MPTYCCQSTTPSWQPGPVQAAHHDYQQLCRSPRRDAEIPSAARPGHLVLRPGRRGARRAAAAAAVSNYRSDASRRGARPVLASPTGGCLRAKVAAALMWGPRRRGRRRCRTSRCGGSWARAVPKTLNPTGSPTAPCGRSRSRGEHAETEHAAPVVAAPAANRRGPWAADSPAMGNQTPASVLPAPSETCPITPPQSQTPFAPEHFIVSLHILNNNAYHSHLKCCKDTYVNAGSLATQFRRLG